MIFKGAICPRHPELKGRRSRLRSGRALCTGCNSDAARHSRQRKATGEPAPKAVKKASTQPSFKRRRADSFRSRMDAEREQVFSQSVIYCRNCGSGFLKSVVDRLGGRVPALCCGRPDLGLST
jgi:hypothetical protein